MCLGNIAESLEAFGDRFLRRVFTPREIAFATSGGTDMIGRLAECFAAKEAAFKAMGRPDAALRWRDIEVRRAPDGHRVCLGGGTTLSLVLMRPAGHAVAVVIGHG